jgi:chromosome partitioning protein
VITYSVTNQKGGVGKTVITAALGACLAELGYQVLLVDLDPQGHLTTGATGLPPTEPPVTLANAMLGEWIGYPKLLIASWRDRLDVIPTNLDGFLLDQRLIPLRGREYQLARVLEPLADDYDFCLIDAPPSLGILTDNALVAAGRVLIPVQALDSSLAALQLLIDQIRSLEQSLGVSVEIAGLVLNQYDARRGTVVTTAREALESLSVPMLGVVHDRAVINESWRRHVPLIEHAPDSTSAAEFRQLARLVAGRAAV